MESPLKRRGAAVTNGLGAPAKNTLLGCNCSSPGGGVFFFSALDRLKIGVGEGGDDFLVRVAVVLVTSCDVFSVGLAEGRGITAGPGVLGFAVVVALVDDVRIVLPNTVICGAGVCGGCCCC